MWVVKNNSHNNAVVTSIGPPTAPIRASVWATMGEAETEEAWGETDECGDEEVSVHSDAS